MPFDTFTPRMKQVAEAGLRFCKDHYGGTAVRISEEIHSDIKWKPSFHVKRARNLIVAAEVNDILYPEILKSAALDILRFDFPIAVTVICPLEVFQADAKQTTVNLLKKHGFGIITVDDVGTATQQHACIPLAQHICAEELEKEIHGLTPNLKIGFRSAHSTFLVNVGQGLQQSGQIVEAVVNEIVEATVKRGLLPRTVLRDKAADKIDRLYMLTQFRSYRGALGGARDFVKEYRNALSHPSTTPQEAVEKIRKCRGGFIDAIRTAKNLCQVAKANHFRLNIHVT
jgi:hypothetical protein